MSTTPATSPATPTVSESHSSDSDRQVQLLLLWLRIGVIALLMTLLYWPNLRRLWFKTAPFVGEANWQHAFLVPLVGLYYLYVNREALFAQHREQLSAKAKAIGLWLQLQGVQWGILFFLYIYYPPFLASSVGMVLVGALSLFSIVSAFFLLKSANVRRNSSPAQLRIHREMLGLAESSATWFGIFTLASGLLFYAWSIYPGQNDFFKDFSIIITLFGVVLTLCGWGVMSVAWFPIVFLVCAIPWPGLMYSKIAMPLQELAATAAVFTLKICGVDAFREGTMLQISSGRVLNVAEACAGLRSLMTFIALGAAVAFLSSRAMWQKILITVSAVPIAIFCNMMRVAGQGLLDHFWSTKWSESFAHQFAGMVMLIPAIFLILLLGWILDNIFIEEADDRRANAPQKLTAQTGRAGVSAGSASTAGAAELAAATQRLMASRNRGNASSPNGGQEGK